MGTKLQNMPIRLIVILVIMLVVLSSTIASLFISLIVNKQSLSDVLENEQGLLLAALFFLLIGIILSLVFSGIIAKPFKKLEQLHDSASTQNERIKVLLDSTPLACRLWNKDMELFSCNEESLRLFGIENEQEYMRRFHEFSPKYQPDGSLSEERSIELIKKAFEGEKVIVDWVHQTSDGTWFPAEITLIRVPYEGGYAVAGYTRDMREHKRMMDEIERRDKLLQEAHERVKVLLDATPFGSNLWGKDGRIFDCNEASVKLFGLKSKEEYLQRFHDLSPEYQPDGQLSSEKASAFIQKAFEEGRFASEWMHQTLDGELIPAEAILVRVPYGDDFAVAGYTRDLREHNKMMEEIEERDKLLEAALEKSQKASSAKSDFLANMSHEMRTPLNAIIGLSVLSLENEGVDEETQTNLEKIYISGSTLLSIVNDILDISKIEAGKIVLVEAEYDAPSLINNTVTQNILRIGDKPIEFKLDIAGDMLSRLKGDELRVEQIINNLLSNAIKYSDEGVVELAMKSEIMSGNESENRIVWLTIEVRDTGRGIRPEDISKLFSDYTQLDLESSRKIEGTGLGLALTKKLTEMMKGAVSVVSEYGKGSVFTAKIQQKFVNDQVISPEIIESLKKFRYSDEKRSRDKHLKRVSLPYARVLVVDDNLINLDVARGLLKPYGMKVDCVDSGQKAVDLIRHEEKKYNAVFMDHMMPGMDGIEAIRAIRDIGTDYAANIPVVALTANAIAGSKEMFLDKGFQAFLSKPVDLSRLDEVIRLWVMDKKHEEILELLVEQKQLFEKNNKTDRKGIQMAIAGLDIRKGKERFSDETTYIKILRSYATNTRPLLESIAQVSEEKLDDYAIVIHGIKSSSRGIFADMIGDSAEKLETAAKTGDFAYVNKYNPPLLDAAWSLVYELEDMLSLIDIENPKPAKDRPDDKLLAKLLAACEAYDMDEADAVMAEIDHYQYSSDDGLTDWLRENIGLTNFKQIKDRLKNIKLEDE